MIAERAAVGGPSAKFPYVDAAHDKTGIGITVGDTVAIRLTPPATDIELTAKVVAGGQHVRIGSTENKATADECTLTTAKEPLFIHGKTSTAKDESGGHHECRIEISQNNERVGFVEPLVYEPLPLKVRIWKFSASPEETDSYQGLTVYGTEVDIDRVMEDVAAYWRPAGLAITVEKIRTGHLWIEPAQQQKKIDVAVNDALKADETLQEALGDTVKEKVVNIVLVPAYDRFGLTFTKWLRDDPDQKEPKAGNLSGFAGPVAVVAVNGAISPQWSWTSRSTDTAFFDRLPGDEPEQNAVAFHYLTLASDVAHELGHLLGLAHTAEPKTSAEEAPRLFTMLMHPRVLIREDQCEQQGWPQAGLGHAVDTKAVAVIEFAAGPSRLAPQQPKTVNALNVASLMAPIAANTRLLLTYQWQVKPVTVSKEAPKSSNRPTTVSIDKIVLDTRFEAGSVLLQATSEEQRVKGGLIPAGSITQARAHITAKYAFGI